MPFFKHKKSQIIAFMLLLVLPLVVRSGTIDKAAGRILLQVEENGEAWYVSPLTDKRYYLGRPADALSLMRQLGSGISDENLGKIPVGLIDYDDADDDNDGLGNRLEAGLGTDPDKNDTDGDGWSDYREIREGYDPLGAGALPLDTDFTRQVRGRIFLQVEQSGEAWYLNPADSRRYYLGRPADAFQIMRELSLGINNENLADIMIGTLDEPEPPPPPCQNCAESEAERIMQAAGAAIRAGNIAAAKDSFAGHMSGRIEHTMDYLDEGQRLILGNILSGAALVSKSENIYTFGNDVFFGLGGYEVAIEFYVERQEDGTWKIANL